MGDTSKESYDYGCMENAYNQPYTVCEYAMNFSYGRK
jgi:hypothetical protein